jgi:hypothetical protein
MKNLKSLTLVAIIALDSGCSSIYQDFRQNVIGITYNTLENYQTTKGGNKYEND